MHYVWHYYRNCTTYSIMRWMQSFLLYRNCILQKYNIPTLFINIQHWDIQLTIHPKLYYFKNYWNGNKPYILWTELLLFERCSLSTKEKINIANRFCNKMYMYLFIPFTMISNLLIEYFNDKYEVIKWKYTRLLQRIKPEKLI